MPNKAIAAGGTSAVAGSIVTLCFAIWGHNVAPEISDAATTLVTAVLSGLATYFVPHEGAR